MARSRDRGLGRVRDPRRHHRDLEAHRRQSVERVGCVSCVDAEADRDLVARVLQRRRIAEGRSRAGGGGPGLESSHEIEADGVRVATRSRAAVVADITLEQRVDTEPLEEVEDLGRIYEMARLGEVVAELAAAAFGAAVLKLPPMTLDCALPPRLAV